MNDRRTRFEAIFREVYEPLQRYARRRIDPASADDVVAEALLVVWRRLDEAPDGLSLPWCYGIARRCLANRRRGEQRQANVVDRLMGERDAPPGDGDPSLWEALGELDADDREIVRLWAWEALQPREIAVVLDISANAAAIRVHRAKRRLGDAMERVAGRKSRTDAGHRRVGNTPLETKEAT